MARSRADRSSTTLSGKDPGPGRGNRRPDKWRAFSCWEVDDNPQDQGIDTWVKRRVQLEARIASRKVIPVELEPFIYTLTSRCPTIDDYEAFTAASIDEKLRDTPEKEPPQKEKKPSPRARSAEGSPRGSRGAKLKRSRTAVFRGINESLSNHTKHLSPVRTVGQPQNKNVIFGSLKPSSSWSSATQLTKLNKFKKRQRSLNDVVADEDEDGRVRSGPGGEVKKKLVRTVSCSETRADNEITCERGGRNAGDGNLKEDLQEKHDPTGSGDNHHIKINKTQSLPPTNNDSGGDGPTHVTQNTDLRQEAKTRVKSPEHIRLCYTQANIKLSHTSSSSSVATKDSSDDNDIGKCNLTDTDNSKAKLGVKDSTATSSDLSENSMETVNLKHVHKQVKSILPMKQISLLEAVNPEHFDQSRLKLNVTELENRGDSLLTENGLSNHSTVGQCEFNGYADSLSPRLMSESMNKLQTDKDGSIHSKGQSQFYNKDNPGYSGRDRSESPVTEGYLALNRYTPMLNDNIFPIGELLPAVEQSVHSRLLGLGSAVRATDARDRESSSLGVGSHLVGPREGTKRLDVMISGQDRLLSYEESLMMMREGIELLRLKERNQTFLGPPPFRPLAVKTPLQRTRDSTQKKLYGSLNLPLNQAEVDYSPTASARWQSACGKLYNTSSRSDSNRTPRGDTSQRCNTKDTSKISRRRNINHRSLSGEDLYNMPARGRTETVIRKRSTVSDFRDIQGADLGN